MKTRFLYHKNAVYNLLNSLLKSASFFETSARRRIVVSSDVVIGEIIKHKNKNNFAVF